LYVWNLATTTKADELRTLFGKHGKVTNVTIPLHPVYARPLGFGFVEMADGAQSAIAALDGAAFQGRTLSVNDAVPLDNPLSDKQFLDVRKRFAIWCDRPESPEFRQARNDLIEQAEIGRSDAVLEFAWWLAYNSPERDLAAAYKVYYIAFAHQGYRVEFDDQNHSPPHYCGPVGDFRNEAQVSDLVTELGFDRVRELDAEVERWMVERNLRTCPGSSFDGTESE